MKTRSTVRNQQKQVKELRRRVRANAWKKINNVNKTLRSIKTAEKMKALRQILLQQTAEKAPVTVEENHCDGLEIK